MKLPKIPVDENERLKALSSYEILDTDFEEKFDNLTSMASSICGTKIALISLIDENRQWFKSCVGLDARQTSRGISFCGHAINNPKELFEIVDAKQDARFFDNPLVIGEPYIRFYAGQPIISSDGHPLGTLCVIDSSPKKLSKSQRTSLKYLAKQVYHLFQLRKSEIKLREEKQNFKGFAELSPNILYRYSSNPDLIYHSPIITEILGYPPIAFKKNANLWIDLVHKDDRELAIKTAKLAKQGQRIDAVYRMKNKKGNYRWIHDISTSIHNDGNHFLIEGIASDITETKNYQDSINELNQRYNTAMSASNDAIWEYQQEKDELRISNHFYEWIKASKIPDTITLKDFRGNVHPDDQQKITHLIDHLFNHKFKNIDVDIRIQLSKNTYKWFNLRGGLIEALTPTIAGSISEIHLRKQNEQELLKAKSLFSEASKLAKLGAWELDVETNNVKWSDVTYYIHDIDEEQKKVFKLEDAIDFYLDKDQKIIKEKIQLAIENGLGYDEIFQLETIKGKLKWIRTIAKVEFDPDTRKRKIFGVIQDITNEVKAREKQDSLLELTKKQNNRLKNFAYIVSHNLRSHASNFSSLLNLMNNEELNHENQEIFDMLNTSSSNLLQTIEDLSKVAGLYNKADVDFTKLNLKDILQQVVNNLIGVIKEKNIQLDLSIDKTVYIKGLPSYVESIFFNMISNAIKYANPTKDKRLKISLNENKKHAIIKFEDNGLGIDLKKHGDDLFKMYKIFHKGVDDARGLGLFITKNQIEFMKGSIDVQSNVGKGTTFTIYFKKLE